MRSRGGIEALRVIRPWFAVLLCLSLLAGLASAGERITRLDAAGFRADLAERRGRVVLVNFWATWCRPCREEIPALMSLQEELGERGFDLVAVSLDDPADRESLLEPFLAKWFPAFTTYLSAERDMDAMVSVVDPYWNEVLPTSYLLSRDGTMVRRIQGGSTKDGFRAAIEPLLD
ncbi:MAG: TlpA family protein disulfide reductase [Gammaproteobacteria bacterium]